MTLEKEAAFDRDGWVFEMKWDGFRGLAYIDAGRCELVSRNDNVFEQFGTLARSLASELEGRTAVLDGEVVCLDDQGRAQFYELMRGSSEPYFYAFDLLWLDGDDLREEPLLERKRRLKELVPTGPSRLLYVDHIERHGRALFQKVCELDLEGVVAKPADGLYDTERPTRWVKFKNPSYSQAEGRGELFNRGR